MISRRNLFGVAAAGLSAAIAQPFLPGEVGKCGKVGKYIPHRLTAAHVFAPDLMVVDMATGKSLEHVVAIEVDNGRLRRIKFSNVPEMVYAEDCKEGSKDIFGYRRMVPHPTRTVSIMDLDEHGMPVYENVYGQFELNWKERKVPERVKKIKDAAPAGIWKEMCKNGRFDIEEAV